MTRFGGDEFSVIVRDATKEDGDRFAERVLAATRELAVAGANDALKVTVSIGIAEVLPGETADRWLARADGAL